MNKQIVLDASALLALLNQEPGHKRVESILPHAVISSVNYSETITVLTQLGLPSEEAYELTHEIIQEIIPFDTHLAYKAASLRKMTQPYGLSLGDRACLALAQQFKAHVLTADKIWNKLKIDSVEIEIIR